MKSTSEISIPPDEGMLLQRVVKRGLIVLSLAIIILSGVALWTTVQLTDFYQVKVQHVSEQKQLLHVMRIAAMERILTLHSMVIEDDRFKIDDKRMAFYSKGSKFIEARTDFLKTPLTKYELDLITKQDEITKGNSLRREYIVDEIIKGESKSALKLLKELGDNNIIPLLHQLNISIDKRHKNVKEKANSFGKISIIILFSIVAIIILGAIYISRKTTYRAFNLISQLTDAHKILDDTNLELIQQKDTLDHHAIVSIADEKGNITYVNNKFCEVSGYSRDELIGNNHRMLKSNIHSKGFYQELWSTISHGNIWQGKICNYRKDGSQYWVESTISPFFDTEGNPYQYVSIRTDITQLLEAKIEAEKASLAKSTFLSSMSHELRTPMNAVLGFAQLLKLKKNPEDDELQWVNEILNSGNHLIALINDVLDLSKIETEQFELLIEEVDIESLINECLLMVENMAHNQNIKLQQPFQASSNLRVLADRVRLKQSLLNFLSNAIKYNSQNGEVIVSIKSIDSNKCRILIKDSGKGLSDEQRSIIFNPFTRLDEHINIIEGTGIGLTITQNLIEMMNGKIGAESEIGSGSTFWIELPTV